MTRSSRNSSAVDCDTRTRSIRILLVEDDRRLVDAYQLYFEDAGCATRAVGRVDDALDQLA